MSAKKVLSAFLILVMVISLLPGIAVPTQAAGETVYPYYVITHGAAPGDSSFHVYKKADGSAEFVAASDTYSTVTDAVSAITTEVGGGSATLQFGNTGTDDSAIGTLNIRTDIIDLGATGSYVLKGSLQPNEDFGNSSLVRLEGASVTVDGAEILCNNGNLGNDTITNNGDGNITVSGGSVYVSGDNSNHAIVNNGGGSVTISGGTVSADDGGQAIVNNGDGNVTVSGGTVSASYAITNGGTGSVTVSGNGTVSGAYAIMNGDGNVTVSGGGTVYGEILNSGTGNVTVSDGTISAEGGDAIYNTNTGSVNLSGNATVTGSVTIFHSGTLFANSGGSTPVYYSGTTIDLYYNESNEPIVSGTTIAVSGVNDDNASKFNLISDEYMLIRHDNDLVITAPMAQSTSPDASQLSFNKAKGTFTVAAAASTGTYKIYFDGNGTADSTSVNHTNGSSSESAAVAGNGGAANAGNTIEYTFTEAGKTESSKTADGTVPAAATIPVLDVSVDDKVTISWTPSASAGTYNVYWGMAEESTGVDTSAEIRALTAGATTGNIITGSAVTTTGQITITADYYVNCIIEVVDANGNTSAELIGTAVQEHQAAPVSHPGTLAFSNATYATGEGDTSVTITVTRTGGSDGAVSVDYATAAGGSATAGSDYTATSGTLSFANGDTANKTFTVAIIQDAVLEGNETVNLTLGNVQGGATLGLSSAALTITDDEAAPPGTPAGVTAIPGNTRVTLNWNSVTGATGYKIYQSVTSGTYGMPITSAAGSVYSYEATGLTNGTLYYFVIRATNGVVDSPNSTEVSAVPKTIPGAPTNVSATAGSGQATVSFTAPANNGGSTITGYIVTSSPENKTATGTGTGITVTGLSNGTAYTFTVKAVNAAGNGTDSTASNAVIPYSPSSGGGEGSTTPATPTPTSNTGVTIQFNGKTETAATATTTTVGDKTVTTVTLDDKKVEERLRQEGNNAVVTIPVTGDADVVLGQISGQTIKNMEIKEAVLEIKTGNVTYTLPASQINIDNISSQIGKEIQLKDITVNVQISASSPETAKVVESTADKNNYQVVVKPVDFEITCKSGDKTVDVSRFNGYVERLVEIPDGIDPSKITTGIVLNKDGTFSHVPTTITVINGRYYAKINSLTNSIYSVIWNPMTFQDAEKHWAKDAINNMGSRLVISGVGEDRFEPDRDITRAEFAAIVVRALGLMRPGAGNDSFADVSKNDWYYDAVSIAYENGVLSGYGNGKYGPMDNITREQAMTMIARTMKITKLKVDFKVGEAEQLLAAYTDSPKAAGWAKESIASCVKAGIISGRTNNLIVPEGNITRAEVAAIVQRLLKKSNLIN